MMFEVLLAIFVLFVLGVLFAAFVLFVVLFVSVVCHVDPSSNFLPFFPRVIVRNSDLFVEVVSIFQHPQF